MLVFLIITSVILGILIAIFRLFTEQIILVESVIMGLVAGFLMKHFTEIHPAFCLLIGIASFLAMFIIQHTKFGFWIVGGIMSLAWGLLFAVFAYDGTGGDMVWTYTVWGLGTLIVLGLHKYARSSHRVTIEIS